MTNFEQLNDQLLVNSKLSLTPHWIDPNLNFKITKKYGPKYPPQGVIWVPNIRPKFDDSNLALALRVQS